MKSIPIVCLCLMASTLFAQSIYYLEGSTEKIEQLVGDYDRHLLQATNNLTETRYGIWGTDLGVPFNHKDTIFVVFGDIPGDQGFGTDRDPIAYTLDTNPEDGIDLTFLTQSPGQYQPITIPGITQSAFEVPQDGISLNNMLYLYYSTDFMTRSTLARSADGGRTFQLIEDTVSVTKFINISAEIVERSTYPHLPGNANQGVLIFGTGEYRKS